jgi:hypothetical protein
MRDYNIILFALICVVAVIIFLSSIRWRGVNPKRAEAASGFAVSLGGLFQGFTHIAYRHELAKHARRRRFFERRFRFMRLGSFRTYRQIRMLGTVGNLMMIVIALCLAIYTGQSLF